MHAVGDTDVSEQWSALDYEFAAIAEFAGAFFAGGEVSNTIRKGMIDPLIFQDAPLHLVYGMIGALVASGIWLHLASSLGWPVSTTHSIVGAVIGFGIVAGGVDAISWTKMGQVAMSWVISPVMGGVISFIIFRSPFCPPISMHYKHLLCFRKLTNSKISIFHLLSPERLRQDQLELLNS